MADAQKTIDLIFNGVDKTGAATKAALDNAQKFTGSLKNVTQPISDFTLGAGKLEAGLLGAGLAMTVFAVKTAGDFDTSFRQITTLVDGSAEDMGKFKQSILDYAEGSTQPLEQITASLSAAIGSGVDWSKSLDLIGVAEKLAVSTRADLKSTTETLVGTLNAYGMKTTEAGKVSDLFFQIIKDGKIEMTDLSASFANITAIAPQSGVSLVDVGAAIATLTATSMKPSTAIDALKSAISNIIKPSKQASDMAAELGIQFDANALKSKGFSGVLNDVAKATGGSADKLSLLFGDMTGLGAVMLLTGTQSEKFNSAIVSMGNSAGSVDVAFAKMGGNLDQSLAKVAGAFKVLLVNIGSPLLDEFGGIANAIAKIFSALAASVKDGALKDLVGYIESVFGNIQGALETVAKNLPAALAGADFSGFKDGIGSVLTAVKGLFGNIDLTSVEGLRMAIETMGAAFLGLSKYTAGVIEAFEPLFAVLIDVGKGASDVDLSFLEFAGNLGGIATQLNVVLPLFSGLLAILTVKSGMGLLSEMKGLVTVIPLVATALGTAGLAGAAGTAGYAVGSVLNEGISALLSKITGSETTLGSWIYDLTHAGDVATTAGEKTAGAAKGVGELGKAADSSVSSFEKSNEAMLKNFAASDKAAGSTVKLADAQKNVVKYALETVPVFDAVTGKISGYEQRLVASAKGTVDLGTATGNTAKGLGKIGEETEKAKDATRKWNEEVAKMKFDEKIKLIDSQTKIAVANIEADAKKAVAAFESISGSIKSTGELLGSLFGNLKDENSLSWSSLKKINDQIDKENKLRQDSFALQKRLTEATIKQMEAQTNALAKGDGLIKIDGAGLKPHLEAFMWEILQTIQVRVNADGLKLLLGQ